MIFWLNGDNYNLELTWSIEVKFDKSWRIPWNIRWECKIALQMLNKIDKWISLTENCYFILPSFSLSTYISHIHFYPSPKLPFYFYRFPKLKPEALQIYSNFSESSQLFTSLVFYSLFASFLLELYLIYIYIWNEKNDEFQTMLKNAKSARGKLNWINDDDFDTVFRSFWCYWCNKKDLPSYGFFLLHQEIIFENFMLLRF